MKSEFLKRIENYPVIAAITDLSKVYIALESQCEIIFLLTGNIFNLKELVQKIQETGKLVFVHVDLLDGFSRDFVALEYIHDKIAPDGIITTKSKTIIKAKEMDIFVIERCFLVDSHSIETGIASVKKSSPNAIEILPGIIPKVTKKFVDSFDIPVITGGLINKKSEVIENLKVGAKAISTTDISLWNI